MSVLQQLWIPLNNEQHHTWQIVWLTSGNILWVLILCLQVSSHPNVCSAPVGIPQVVAPGAHQHQQHHLIFAILFYITCRQWFCIDRPGCNWLHPDSQADRSRRCRSACRSSPSSSAFTTWVFTLNGCHDHVAWQPCRGALQSLVAAFLGPSALSALTWSLLMLILMLMISQHLTSLRTTSTASSLS